MKSLGLGVLLLLLWSTSTLADSCGEAGAKHWTTVVKLAVAPVTLHWTGVNEGRDSVCAISLSRSPTHLQMLNVWGQPEVNAASSLIAFDSCEDDGCRRTILVADVARGVVLKSSLPLADQELYFSLSWKGPGRTLAVQVQGVQGQPPQHLTCSISEQIVCARR
ncbi:MAG: hypothetical protein WA747_08405 [Steroidobacteraceae bacterium]